MASVRVRLRGSSLDPARTTIPLIRTGTQHTLGPIRISCHWPKDGKERPILLWKKEIATPKNTSKPKKKGPDCFCFCFCFCFALHLSFSMVKGFKLKEKSKRKKKRSPDPGHYWPDTDSGPGSGQLWPGFWFGVRTRIRIYGSGSVCLP